VGAAADYSPDEDEKGRSYGDFLSFSPTGVSSNKRRLLVDESLGLEPGTIILLVISSKESRLYESWRRFVGLQISAVYALSFVRDKVTHIQIVVHVDHNAEGPGTIQGTTERSDAIRQIETGSAGFVLSLKGSTARSQQLLFRDVFTLKVEVYRLGEAIKLPDFSGVLGQGRSIANIAPVVEWLAMECMHDAQLLQHLVNACIKFQFRSLKRKASDSASSGLIGGKANARE